MGLEINAKPYQIRRKSIFFTFILLNLLNQEKVFAKFPSDKENTDICGQSNSSIGDIAHYNLKHFMLKLCACKQEQNFFLRYPPSKLIQ